MGLFDRFKPIPDKEIEGLHLPEKEPQIVDGEEVVSVWEGTGNTKFHQRRYFEGFTQYETLGQDGKLHRHNVYAGYWYIQQLTKRERILHRVFSILLCLVGAALMVFAATRTIVANAHAFAALAEFAALFGFCWTLIALFNEFTVPQKRTIGDYRSSSLGLKRSGIVAMIAGCVSCIITVIYAISSDNTGLHLLAALCELLSAATGFGIWWLERKVVYKKELSEFAGRFSM